MDEALLKGKWKHLKTKPTAGGSITLVQYPARQVLIDHAKTLKEELPIKAGTPDSYVHQK